MSKEDLIEDLKTRKSVSDISVIGPIVLVMGDSRNSTYLFMAKKEHGYRVGAVLPSSNIILYVPEDWGEEIEG